MVFETLFIDIESICWYSTVKISPIKHQFINFVVPLLRANYRKWKSTSNSLCLTLKNTDRPIHSYIRLQFIFDLIIS